MEVPMRYPIIFVLMLLPILLIGANLYNVPTVVTCPDGNELHLYASGDEYINRLHDAKGYTIVQSPIDGYYYYAIKSGDDLVPSAYRVGSVDPVSLGIETGLNVSETIYKDKKRWMQSFHDTKPNHRAPSSGTVNNLNVFIRFSDQEEFDVPRSEFDNKFNLIGDDDYSLRNYFKKVSYNQLDYVTHHYPVSAMDINLSYQDSQPRNYYVPYNAVTNPIGYADSWERAYREHLLLANAINFISAQVPASLNIDADNDGYVDNVCFVIRGPHTAWADLLWAHRWVLYYQDAYINGKQVWDYTFQPENHNEVRVLCHEMFHSVGAPDLYHYTFNGIAPTGCWDIMESGYGHMGAWMKHKYGSWINNIPVISTAGYYTLNPLSSPTGNVFRTAGPNDTEFFLFEYRKQDADVFEQNLPTSGLLVYRIKSTLNGNADGPPDEVYIYRPNGTATTNGLIFEAPFSADHYRTAMNNWTNPSPFLLNGTLGNLNISDVSYSGDTISFYYNPQNTQIPPVVRIQDPAPGAVLPIEVIQLSAVVTHPQSDIAYVSFYMDEQLIGTVDSPPYTLAWDASAVNPGAHQLVVSAATIEGYSNSSVSQFRIIDPEEPNWFSWITAEPVYERFGRGQIPIRIAIDLDLGVTEYYVKKLAFNIENDPWGVAQYPGLVNAKINRFSGNTISEVTIMDIGDIISSMDGRYEHEINSEQTISGKIAVVLDIKEYKKMLFDHNGVCGHSWITETGRPWTDAIARGVVGAAMIELQLQAPITSVDDAGIPIPIQSLRAYPNPFNPNTTLEFQISTPGKTNISIYNLKGQKVKTLADSHYASGKHSIVWNGMDSKGASVSSGIYLVKLTGANGHSTMRKVLLNK